PASPSASASTNIGGSAGTGMAAHDEALILFVSRVTAPLRASARPTRLAPVVMVMLVSARMLPTSEVEVPTVADEPTCQNTLHGDPLPLMITDELEAVVSVLPILKIHIAAALPWPFSVRVPVSWAGEEEQYTRGVSPWPPRSCPVKSSVHDCPAALLYAVVSADCAESAAASAACIAAQDPRPGGKQVTAAPGLNS